MFAYLGITGDAREKARELDIEYPSSSDDGNIALKKQRTGDPADQSVGTELNLELSSSSERLKHVKGNMTIQDYDRFDDAAS